MLERIQNITKPFVAGALLAGSVGLYYYYSPAYSDLLADLRSYRSFLSLIFLLVPATLLFSYTNLVRKAAPKARLVIAGMLLAASGFVFAAFASVAGYLVDVAPVVPVVLALGFHAAWFSAGVLFLGDRLLNLFSHDTDWNSLPSARVWGDYVRGRTIDPSGGSWRRPAGS